ncbi:MAG TPA: glycosyltransferase [Marmoricola sp.]|nr:glycosyltransferase [Marmoricola sp.]
MHVGPGGGAPAPAPPPTMSVVICAYTVERWSQVCAAVSSVLQQDRPPEQVLLVIDHCAELERRSRETFAPDGVEVLANTGPAGLSGARNTGTSSAVGDVVAFLDDDAVALPGWLQAHAAQYSDPAVLGVGGRVTAHWVGRQPGWFPAEFGWVVGCSYVGQPTVIAPVRNPIGANMSFRRHVIERAGGFSAGLGRVGSSGEGCEETELAIRAAQLFRGGRIMHVPAAEVRHHVAPTRGTWSYFWRRCWAEGRSKARMSGMVDRLDALASERVYVRQVLTRSIGRNLAQALGGADTFALSRAGAITAGVVITSAGFAAGKVSGVRLAGAGGR